MGDMRNGHRRNGSTSREDDLASGKSRGTAPTDNLSQTHNVFAGGALQNALPDLPASVNPPAHSTMQQPQSQSRYQRRSHAMGHFKALGSSQSFAPSRMSTKLLEASSWRTTTAGAPFTSSSSIHPSQSARGLFHIRNGIATNAPNSWSPSSLDSHSHSFTSSQIHSSTAAPTTGTAVATLHPKNSAQHVATKSITSPDRPKPSAKYLEQASQAPTERPAPQPLLVVMDLNGTLIHRPRDRRDRSAHMQIRPSMERFLDYLFDRYTVMVWSSARPKNIGVMCKKLFTARQMRLLAGTWSRDDLDLTREQYAEKVQVYKQLSKLWSSEAIQATYPAKSSALATPGPADQSIALGEDGDRQRWGQHNTVLLDDSFLKGSSEPHNLILVPEFTGTSSGSGASPQNSDSWRSKTAESSAATTRIPGLVYSGAYDKVDVLRQVAGYLEALRFQRDVSAFIRTLEFKVNVGWEWEWEGQEESGEEP